LARHTRVHEDVLQLARAAAAARAEAESRPPVADLQFQPAAQMDGAGVVAPGAKPDLEGRRRFRPVLGRDHLHELTHDTETQAARKIDASAAAAGAGEAPHGVDVPAAQTWLCTAAANVKTLQH